MALYGVETWTRRGEAFSVYFNLLTRLSIFETRDREVGRRPLLRGLPPLERPPGIVAFVVVMIGTVTFDGLSQGSLWKRLSGGSSTLSGDAGRHDRAAARRRAGGRLLLARDGGREDRRRRLRHQTLARAFVHSLVPIAAVYVAAHYLTFLIFEGQAIRYTAADPFGQGWDLFGWASTGSTTACCRQNAAWYLQVALVVSGTSPRSYWRTTARCPLPSAPVGGALPVLDAGDHDRLHDAGAVAARAGGARERRAALLALVLAARLRRRREAARPRPRRRARTGSSTSPSSRRS